MHTRAHTCTHMHTRAHTHAHTCTHTHTHAHTRTHMHTHAHTRTHMHTRIPRHMLTLVPTTTRCRYGRHALFPSHYCQAEAVQYLLALAPESINFHKSNAWTPLMVHANRSTLYARGRMRVCMCTSTCVCVDVCARVCMRAYCLYVYQYVCVGTMCKRSTHT